MTFSLPCSHSVRRWTAFGVCSRWVSVILFTIISEHGVRELCVPHVHMAPSSSVFLQIVSSGLEGGTKSSFSLGPGSSSKRGTKIRARRSSDCKNETTLKKGGKKQGHSQSERSGAYTEKVSVHHTAAVATEHSRSPANGVFQPSTQVNCCFV